MKNSGIEWIGEIPDDWKVGALKYFYSMQTGFTPSTQNDNYYDDESGMIWVTISDITNAGKYIYDSKSKISKKYLTDYTPKITPSNSLLYSFKLSIGTVAFAGVPLYTNEAIASFIKTEKVNLNFLYYSSFLILYNANTNIYGAKLLNQDLIRNAKIIFPPLSAQQQIADYLDKKCAAVDRMIENQRAQIEKLKEYKQSVITEAVTRGLDPSAPMKDSGVEWLGEIPMSWNVMATKNLFRIVSGSTPKSDNIDFWDGDIIWITPSDFSTEDVFVYHGKRNISLQGLKSCSTALVPKNSIIFSKRAPIGLVVINGNELCTNQGCLSCVNITNQNIKFFYYTMSICTEQYEILGSGTTFKEISAKDFANFKLPCPTKDEQRQIADYLDKKCAEIDKLIAIKQQKIETLTEYKKSLIYEYVTGKKQVG